MTEQVEFMTNYLDSVRRHIHRNGWMVQAVVGDEVSPIRCYSMGLSNFNHPEIVLIGFEHLLMTRLINAIGAHVQEGKQYRDWSVVRGIIKHYPVVLREVPPHIVRECAGLLTRFFPNARLLQMFLPDANGRFPWQALCQSGYKAQMCLDYVSSDQGILIL